MSEMSEPEAALVLAIKVASTATTLSPGPSPCSPSAKTAVRRCCAAWQRAFKASIEKSKADMDEDEDSDDDSETEFFAAKDAAIAYRNAMPMLADYDGVRDFLACVAHGILINAIPAERSGQLLYAAQVALGALQFERKTPNFPQK